MEFKDAMAQRHSVRAFTDQPVSDELLNELLATATSAPSWSNTQPYQIAVAKGAVLEDLRERLPPMFDDLVSLARGSKFKQLKAMVTKDGVPDGISARSITPRIRSHAAMPRGSSCMNCSALSAVKNGPSLADAEKLSLLQCAGRAVHLCSRGAGRLQSAGRRDLPAKLDAGGYRCRPGTCAQGALAIWRSPLEKHFSIPEPLLRGLSLGYEADETINRFKPQRQPLQALLVPER